jgi:hypothetical protein
MGKATNALESLSAQVLTVEELEKRRAAVENGGNSEATSDGTLVKPVPAAPEQLREVTRVPGRTWD